MIHFQNWRGLSALAALALATACAPKDVNVKRPTRSPWAQAKIERANISGIDYLQYTAYRLSEVKRVVELVAEHPTPIANSSEPACGRLVVDKVEGSRRLMRLKTQSCKLAEVKDGRKTVFTLLADGEEVLDVQLNSQGRIVRLVSNTFGPYSISGEVKMGEMDGSVIRGRERRELVLDLVNGDESVGERYRYTYAVELMYRQELRTKTFQAFENAGRNQLQLSGELNLNHGQVDLMTLDLARVDVNVEREVSERSRRANSLTPNKTFHNVTLLLEGSTTDKGVAQPLSFESEECSMPIGSLRVVNFKTSLNNDRITKDRNYEISLSPMGVRAVAVNRSEPWGDCRPQLDLTLPGGGKVTVPGIKPVLRVGEVGNRNPYMAIFLK